METIDPTQVPEAQFKKISMNLDVPLCEGEIIDAAKKLAAADEERFAVEREKSQVSQGFAKRLRELTKIIARYSMQINSGFEERDIPCEVRYNYPDAGMKTVTRLDTMAVVQTLSMGDDEMQEVLPFDGNAEDEDDSDLDGDDTAGGSDEPTPKEEANA